jgi:hypothetical protein
MQPGLKVLPHGRAMQAHARGQRAALSVRGGHVLTGGACEALGPLALFGAAGAAGAVAPQLNTAIMEGTVVTAVALSHDGAEAICAEARNQLVGLFGMKDLQPIIVVAECSCPARALAFSRDDQSM